jgi:hypothetical protein
MGKMYNRHHNQYNRHPRDRMGREKKSAFGLTGLGASKFKF